MTSRRQVDCYAKPVHFEGYGGLLCGADTRRVWWWTRDQYEVTCRKCRRILKEIRATEEKSITQGGES